METKLGVLNRQSNRGAWEHPSCWFHNAVTGFDGQSVTGRCSSAARLPAQGLQLTKSCLLACETGENRIFWFTTVFLEN